MAFALGHSIARTVVVAVAFLCPYRQEVAAACQVSSQEVVGLGSCLGEACLGRHPASPAGVAHSRAVGRTVVDRAAGGNEGGDPVLVASRPAVACTPVEREEEQEGSCQLEGAV